MSKNMTGQGVSENLTTRSINSFIDLIRSGKLKRGEKLPPQDVMAKKFGVSRTALREALKELSYRGIIASRHGQGTYVCDNMVQEEDTLEARLILEPRTAYLATQRAPDPEIRELREMCVVMEEHVKARAYETFSEYDLMFHSTIAKMSRNQALSMLISSVRDMMLHQQNVVQVIPGAMERAHIFHLEIVKAMRERQPEAAQTAMSRHLEDVSMTIQTSKYKDRIGEIH